MDDISASFPQGGEAMYRERRISLLHVDHGVTPAKLWRSVSLDPDVKRGLVIQQGPLGNALSKVVQFERSFSQGERIPMLM